MKGDGCLYSLLWLVWTSIMVVVGIVVWFFGWVLVAGVFALVFALAK